MKLFQIEEPDGSPSDPDAPGTAIGIDLSGATAVVAVSVGGNAVVLADREGFEQDLAVPAPDAGPAEWEDLFVGTRLRAERALAQPVTHAVVAVTALGGDAATSLAEAAGRAGLAVLRMVSLAEFQPGLATALAAAILAEELTPRPDPGGMPGANFT